MIPLLLSGLLAGTDPGGSFLQRGIGNKNEFSFFSPASSSYLVTFILNRADTLSKDSLPDAKAVQEVLFATNEDCELYIGNEYNGSVWKSDHRFIKLAPGPYLLKAKSKTTGDEWKESFTVKERGTNEVFIDLLYIVDENKRQREAVKKESPVVKAEPAIKKENTAKVEVKKEGTAREKETAVLNALLANMVPIKGGSFTMGNNKAPAADEAEHAVTISPVLFGKYEVTQQQWESLMGYNPSVHKGCPTCPVENVSWAEATLFIKKLNALSNKKFRLPTEAEWEYTARMGGKEEIEKAGGTEAYIKKTAWYYGNAEKKTHPVGSKQSTSSGIYDLLGNVSEWCADWYSPRFYREEISKKNPDGPPLGKEKVVRGGAFTDYSGDRFRPSLRNKLKPTQKSSNLGFRVVMEMD